MVLTGLSLLEQRVHLEPPSFKLPTAYSVDLRKRRVIWCFDTLALILITLVYVQLYLLQ